LGHVPTADDAAYVDDRVYDWLRQWRRRRE
jgi:hypothetical protein